MRRYWIPRTCFIDTIENPLGLVEFKDEIFHHIFDVCRQQKGFQFEVLKGDQKAYLVEVVEIQKKKAFGKILSFRDIPPLKKPHFHLALSVSRFPVMDAIVEKCVELGVHSVHPFFSDFSYIRRPSELPENKIERWHKIIISATQQSGRGEMMGLLPAQSLIETLSYLSKNSERKLGVFAYEGQTPLELKKFIEKKKKEISEIDEVWIFVGSEGGFSSEEVEEFKRSHLEPITLGDQVLRVETACISLISILKHEFVI